MEIITQSMAEIEPGFWYQVISEEYDQHLGVADKHLVLRALKSNPHYKGCLQSSAIGEDALPYFSATSRKVEEYFRELKEAGRTKRR